MMFSLRPSGLDEMFSRHRQTRAAIAGWMNHLVHAIDALVFPWSCVLCGSEGLTEPFCGTCRGELLAQSASAAGAACPRCALKAGPFADLSQAVRPAVAARWASTRHLHSGHTMGQSGIYACSSSMNGMRGWPLGLSGFFSSRAAMHLVAWRRRPASYRSHSTGGDTGSAVITRPRHLPMAWHSSSRSACVMLCGVLWQRPSSPR